MKHASTRLTALAIAVATVLITPAAAGATATTAATTTAATAAAGTARAGTAAGTVAPGQGVTLVAYDSFPTKDSPLVDALADFTAQSGSAVQIVISGDTGTMVAKAKLTAGNPEGDVIWGVDNTFLSAAIDGQIFDGDPVAVDNGDVCVNYDLAWFAEHKLAVPVSLDDLLKPEYKDLLVVENPSTSSPGLAFLLATIGHSGAEGWQAYWTKLKANGVRAVDSWDTAYYDEFSATGDGQRPMVVSYGTSPAAEVFYADPPRTDPPTGVAAETCFHQTEYAGVLRGAKHPEQAKALLAFLTSERFQRELPTTLWVYPANTSVTLPDVFRFGVTPAAPFTVDPAQITAHRQEWQEQWTALMR